MTNAINKILGLAECEDFKTEIKVVFSCQKYNLKSSLVQYIHPISYQIAKRQTIEKDSTLLKNDITGSEPTVKMLDT